VNFLTIFVGCADIRGNIAIIFALAFDSRSCESLCGPSHLQVTTDPEEH